MGREESCKVTQCISRIVEHRDAYILITTKVECYQHELQLPMGYRDYISFVFVTKRILHLSQFRNWRTVVEITN